MATEYPTTLDHTGRQPHPYLHEPVLYISGVPPHVTDQDLAVAFVQCAPFRPNIQRDGTSRPLSGTIEFKYMEKAEKALATLQARPIPHLQPPVVLVLSPYPSTTPPTPLPPPSASPRLVKQLPPGYSDSQLYDLFRPFGALASVRTQTAFGTDTGVVEFWREEDAREAEEAMHCVDVEGQNIAVQVYQPRRAGTGVVSEFNAAAPTFVPSGAIMPAYPTQYSPPNRSPYQPPRSPMPFVHGPGQQVQFAPMAGPGASHSGLIDPCNLFIKNLDTSIDSNSLFSHFRAFGQIVSARVMRNEAGESRGFGFVSYQAPDQATAAMHAMNGAVLGSKQLVVRLHEPKQLRQEKLAARFGGHNNHPRSGSGATSPAASDAGDSFAGWPSPSHRPTALGSPVLAHTHDRPDIRARRGSGSYYQAALSGTLNLPMHYDDLAALSPVVRKEVIAGELSRRIKSMDTVPTEDLDSIVESIAALSLSDVLNAITNPNKLAERVQNATTTLNLSKSVPSKSPSPSASQDSRQADALNAPASAPDHPSTPISMPASLSTPPRTESPSGSVPPTSERDRMVAAVSRLESSQLEELTELLMSLPKRERAMCLFNVEVLRAKIADAKMVLEIDDTVERTSAKSPETPATPQAKRTLPSTVASPQTPDLSSRGASAAASPAPATPSSASTTHTIASLARLPAVEIIRLAGAPPADFPLARADPLVLKATNEFIDSLVDKPIQMQKQALGDKLWRIIKAFGIKGAPKLTITLLDQEDLRALAHLMNSYPNVLKEKALLVQIANAK